MRGGLVETSCHRIMDILDACRRINRFACHRTKTSATHYSAPNLFAEPQPDKHGSVLGKLRIVQGLATGRSVSVFGIQSHGPS